MPRKRRTRAHVLADLSMNYVERQVLLCGFVVEQRLKDYGYDFVLYTYDQNGEAENGEIFIQVKATDTLPLLADGERIAFPVSEIDLALWLREPMPVILVLYDAQMNVAYWLYVQAYFERQQRERPGSVFPIRRTRTVYLNRSAPFDQDAVRAIARYRDAVLAQVRGVRHDS